MNIMKIMKMLRNEQGMMLVELTIGLAIGGLLVTVLATVISVVVWLPGQRQDQASVVQDVQPAVQWVTSDANSASAFSIGASPDYGSFNWSDYTGDSRVDYVVTYSYRAAEGYVMRTEQQNGIIASSLAVAKNVAGEGDVAFTWDPSTYSVQLALTSTLATGTLSQDITSTVRSTTVTASLRPRAEIIVSPPSDIAIPTPSPGSQAYYVSANPVLLTGSYVSGGASELVQGGDGAYYVADSTTGSPKEVIYTVGSQSLIAPATISQIQVRFTGNASRDNISVDLFVKDSGAGFPVLSSYTFTFSQNDTNQSVYFNLGPTALAYVNSLPDRRVDLKVSASGDASFSLSTDQIMFIASP